MKTDRPAEPGKTPAPTARGLTRLSFWRLGVYAITALALAPVAVILGMALLPGVADAGTGLDDWLLLLTAALPRATWTTLLLMAGVGLVTGIVGVATAWAVTMYRFPLRGVLAWALVLPLAIPTYIIAFVHVDLMDFTGPVQSTLRAVFGWKSARDYWFPSSRSLPAAIFVMSSVLYPYVYLATRASLEMQSARMLDVARSLGASRARVFWRVALPLARPAIAVGVVLALMECLNDIGAVEYLGVRTLTFAVYDTWLNKGSLAGAAQIACVMLAIVFLLLKIETASRSRQRFHAGRGDGRPAAPYTLSGRRALLATIVCLLPILIGFVVPVLSLAGHAGRRLEMFADPDLVRAARNTMILAAIAALVTVAAGLVLAYAARVERGRIMKVLPRIASLGYAIPGTVLAVGVLIAAATLDNAVNSAAETLFGVKTGLILIASGAAMVYAYVIRYLSIAYGALDSGLSRISFSLDMAARTLNRTAGAALREIHLPLLRPALISAGLLVFVDATKELPATLLLRPFGLETLASFVYVQTTREVVNDAAPAALLIIAVGLIPLLVLSRVTARHDRSRPALPQGSDPSYEIAAHG